jgi:hypothetical protein
MLSLGGYVAFDLPRLVTGLGAALLIGIAATHAYLLIEQNLSPWYFATYAVAAIVGCLLVAGGLAAGRNPRVAQASWYLGSLLSVVTLGVDVATRLAGLPGLTAVTGRWDLLPASFAGAFACAFIALHATVLLGINVAHPQRQQWED